MPARRTRPVQTTSHPPVRPYVHHWPVHGAPRGRPVSPTATLPLPLPTRPPPGPNPTRTLPFPITTNPHLVQSRAEEGSGRRQRRRSNGSKKSPHLRLRSCACPFLPRHGAPPRGRVAPPLLRWPRRGRRREGPQGRVLRRDVPRRRGRRPRHRRPRPRPRGPPRRLRHAPPVSRLLRQRVRRVGADGRDADDGGGEGGTLQHQLAPLLRGGRRDQGGAGGAVPGRRLLRRHHRHGRPGRRRPDRWALLGREARARGQPDGEPGGLRQNHAEPTRQRHHPHQALRRLQPHRHRPRRALRLPLHRRGPLLLHRLPPLQPVGLRPARPKHGPVLPRRTRQALPARRRRERHGGHGRHPARLRQPVLPRPRPPPGIPQLRPDALLRRRRDTPRRDGVRRRPGRLLRGVRRGDDQDGRAAEPREGGDSAQLPRRQWRLAGAGGGGGGAGAGGQGGGVGGLLMSLSPES